MVDFTRMAFRLVVSKRHVFEVDHRLHQKASEA